MIQAKELMIGNWVDDTRTAGNRVGLPKVLHPTKIETIESKEYRYYEPIPLTPEILEKAGFTILEANTYIIKDPEFPHDNYAAIGEYSICCSRDGQWMIMNGCGNTEYIVLYLDYVHELQNWHYLTTGTDLPLTFN